MSRVVEVADGGAAEVTDGGAAEVAGDHLDAVTVRHLRRAKDLIDRRYTEPLDLAALAAEAGFSRYHFARSFRRAFGETPAAYLTRRRIERAKRLLAGANLTVTEICHLVGFNSLGSFSSRFSQLVGRSPTRYRQEAVARGGPPPVPGCFVMAWSRPTGGTSTDPASGTSTRSSSPGRSTQSASSEKPGRAAAS